MMKNLSSCLQYKNEKSIFHVHEGSTPYLSFRALDETGLFGNAFTTKFGGVSTGYLESLNLSLSKEGETEAHILENYRRIGEAAGFDPKRMVLSHQTHTTNVREATEADYGKGLTVPRDYENVDGFVTNVPGLTLVTFYADCVPLYIADPVHRAIGLSHSGWRGTVNRMGKATIEKMQALYGSRTEDLICCIGPSICRDCFEVGSEVAEVFWKEFGEERAGELLLQRNGKFYIDLWRANEFVFLDCGVRPRHIHTTNLCTHCNPDILWSHRSFGTHRGNLGAFLSLREG